MGFKNTDTLEHDVFNTITTFVIHRCVSEVTGTFQQLAPILNGLKQLYFKLLFLL